MGTNLGTKIWLNTWTNPSMKMVMRNSKLTLRKRWNHAWRTQLESTVLFVTDGVQVVLTMTSSNPIHMMANGICISMKMEVIKKRHLLIKSWNLSMKLTKSTLISFLRVMMDTKFLQTCSTSITGEFILWILSKESHSYMRKFGI